MQWDLQSLPSLSTFEICLNEVVESFPEDTLLPSTLTSLEISYLDNLKSLNYKGLQNLTSLEELSISYCSQLVSLPEETKQYPITSLTKLNVYSCPKIEFLPVVALASSKLQSLSISYCDNLTAGRMQWDLQSHPSLSHFEIAGTEVVESFPEETLLPSTLTSLAISDLGNLKSLDNKGLQHLTSLRELKIWHCRSLHSMPEEGLPSSLSSLDISHLEKVLIGYGIAENYLGNLKSLNYNGLQHLTSLEELSIQSCREETKQYPITSLIKFNVCSCPKIESLIVVGLASTKFQSLSVRSCDSLIARRMQWDLESHPFLSNIKITDETLWV
ncbi:unnamed protein product [Dovyalis caffra]|uniref:Disease resistance protein n=1 Tax=Dovyalis caffra TaxID=77055 RepID=A0AAV1RKX7_9ROSI|nr:unnamed protein product [Dovyalis caffra]